MCDQTEVSYLPDDVVWVKLGPVWWPGRVCKEEEIPPEIIKDLRKTPIAIVKFFQEDSFEYVKKLSNIYHYNCLRKNEFIKKGLDVLRSKNRDAPSNMKLFPEDIAKAEYLTGGDPNILENDAFLPEEKPTYADLFGTNKKTPKKLKLEIKKKPQQVQQSAPRLVTHPRFLQLSSGHSTDYEARERKQEPLRAECDEEDNSPPTTYRCTDCDYTTTRLNVIVWHNKSHTHNYASTVVSSKATKRKSTSSTKFKSRSTSNAKVVDEEPINAKIPKSNGSMKVRVSKTPGRSPKTPGRKKLSAVLNVASDMSTYTKENNAASPVKATSQVHRARRHSAPKTDEFQKSLLEDWLEDEIEQEDAGGNAEDIDSHSPAIAQEDKFSSQDSSSIDTSTKGKSCFDFDDSEDHLVIDKSKFKLGRKIPRILNKVKSGKEGTFIDDDVPTKPETMEVDETNIPKYHSGVGDIVTDEHCLSETQNHLQEMGVDNEIEINTEETTGEDSAESVSLASSKQETEVKTEIKIDDAAELSDKVDKLLAEVSTPSTLPKIPHLHKKAHLKAYNESLMNQSRQPQAEQSMKEEISPEIHNIEVSSIPLPPSLPRVTSSICAETRVENDSANSSADTPLLRASFAEDQMSKNELLVAENVEISDKNQTVPENDEKSVIESAVSAPNISTENSAADVSSQSDAAECTSTATPTSVSRPPLKFTTTPKLKQINTSQLLKSGQRTFKIINSTDVNFKSLINKLNINPGNQLSSSKPVSSDQLDTIKTVLKTPDGKSIVCNLTTQPQKVLLANSQASGSPPKFILLNRTKSTLPAAATVPTTVASTAARTIELTNATAVRLAPNILQKSPQKSSAAVAAAAALSKSSGKNIVLDVETFQSLMQSSQTCAKPTQIVLPDALVESTSQVTDQLTAVNADVQPLASQPAIVYVTNDTDQTQNATSTTVGHVAATVATTTSQTIDFNYIVDDSGNLVSVSDVSMLSKDKDILAKALENTDGLQTEMALSDASSSVLDSCSVAQNTEMTYKTDTVFENLTLTTPPIMSAYETPSRAVSTSAISESISNEPTPVVRSGTNNAEYIT